jgi:hypothetical protein
VTEQHERLIAAFGYAALVAWLIVSGVGFWMVLLWAVLALVGGLLWAAIVKVVHQNRTGVQPYRTFRQVREERKARKEGTDQ